MSDKRQINIKVPADTYDQAKEASAKTGVPIRFIVEKALRNWIKTTNKYERVKKEINAG